MRNNGVLVSIHCLVYNHEPFLRQCLDGFVMQKTNFKFEAIVHDDASTDHSADIIREYAEKFPDIIRPIFETENQYSKKDGSIERIMADACTGKYVAFCEGDDYWTDPNKMQKQVDFLESHPEYSMCFHNVIEHWENTDKPDKQFSFIEDRDYCGSELFDSCIVQLASTMMRKEVLKCDFFNNIWQSIKKVDTTDIIIPGDIIMYVCCAHMGKLRGMSNVSSVYRRHDGGATYQMYYWGIIEIQYLLFNILPEPYKRMAKQKFYEGAPHMYFSYRKNKEIRRSVLKKSFQISISGTIHHFTKYVFSSIFCRQS